MRRALILIVLVAAVGAIVIASLNPLYMDEYLYRSLLGTIARNDFRRLTIYPVCEASFLLPVPISWYVPATLLETCYNFLSSPLKLRLGGVLIGCLNLLLVGVVLSSRFPRFDIYSFYGIAFLLSGIFPFFLVISRPEGVVLFCVLSAVVIGRSSPPKRVRVAILSQIFILSIFLFGVTAHPLALFFTPVFAYGIFTRTDRAFLRSFGVFLLALAAIEGALTNLKLLSCPESQSVSEFWGHYGGLRAVSGDSYFALIADRFLNFFRSFANVGYLIPGLSRWSFGIIPPVSLNDGYLSAGVLGGVGFLVLVIALAMIPLGLRRVLMRPRSQSGNDFSLILYLALLVSLVAGLSMEPTSNAYRLTLWVPLIVVLGLVSAKIEGAEELASFLRRFQVPSLLILALSLINFSITFGPMVVRELHSFRTSYPSLSSGIFSSSSIRDDMSLIYRHCHSATTARDLRTGVDGATYWHFIDSKVHFFWYYLLEVHGSTPKSLRDMAAHGMDQVVVRCANVPEELLGESWVRYGEVCCLPPEVIRGMRSSDVP
jgi:nitrate reductase gamma subunit